MTSDSSVIRFYRPDDMWGEFSNFAPFPIQLDGLDWPTSEHWFQAQKFAGTPYAERIRSAPTPMAAAQLGRDRALGLPRDWYRVRDQVMKRGLIAKFQQHVPLRILLLSTGESLLIEHTRNDRYWGDGGDGTGRNRLGLLLMEVRREVRAGREAGAP